MSYFYRKTTAKVFTKKNVKGIIGLIERNEEKLLS